MATHSAWELEKPSSLATAFIISNRERTFRGTYNTDFFRALRMIRLLTKHRLYTQNAGNRDSECMIRGC